MEFSADQAAALAALARFIEAPRGARQSFVMFGLAGTGKTTLLAELTRRYPGLQLTALTGKAASVLRARVGVPVTTLHAAIYDYKGSVEDEDEPGRMNPIFTPKGIPLPNRVILIDEVSMLGGRVARDLLDTGARVVACGDPGQLPPVRDQPFFTNPDATLREVHRQAWGSPIVRQAHAIRSRGDYAADGDAFRVVARPDPADLIAADAILCWRNASRKKLNFRKRELLGITGPLAPGEPVMCLRNNHDLGIYNGAVYEVVQASEEMLALRRGDDVVGVDAPTVEGFDPAFERRRYDDATPFALGYAMTVHKAQGSEHRRVVLYDECDSADRTAFLYTGVTRAVESCVMVRWRT